MSDQDSNQPEQTHASSSELSMAARLAKLKKELTESKQELRAVLDFISQEWRARVDSLAGETNQPEPANFVKSLFQPKAKTTNKMPSLSSSSPGESRPPVLFDAEFYLKQAQSLGLSGAEQNPWYSYVLDGERLGLNPHPLFNTRYYLQQLKWQRPLDSDRQRAQSLTLLEHYLESGFRESISPHPLFWARFYHEQLGEQKIDGCPLVHYLTSGYKLLLKPSPLFDPAFYLARYPDIAQAGIEPLCHYIRCGDLEGRQPNEYFDARLYRQHCGLLGEGETGLEHYLTWGRFAGKKPNRSFDEDYYLEANPDAIDYPGGAFAHFCQIGAREGRRYMPHGMASANPYDDEAFALKHAAPMPSAPSNQDWQELSARPSGSVAVTVIIPVYRNLQLTLACIYSVLKAKCQVPFRLLVVDDCSPEPALSAELRRLSQMGLFELLVNEVNLGFVGTVNRGMSACENGDVVLLNADTVVFDHWLDRLVKAASSDAKIGTVTPLSNNAEICSYPVFCADNNEQLEISFAQLDEIIARAATGLILPLPTAVGFCMLIKRACLAEVGVFDAAAFGKGYGEENDFCLKANASGWKHVLAADTFVRHVGKASFGADKGEHARHGSEVLARRYPFYEKLIDDFCKVDPLLQVRRKIDLARAMPPRWQHSILLFGHRNGGGVERHIRDLAERWESQDVRAVIIRPAKKGGSKCEVHCLDTGYLPNLIFDLKSNWADTERLLQELQVAHIHIHHTPSYGENLGVWVEQVKTNSKLQVDLTIHDYGAICPRLNFIDASGVYCGEPDLKACQSCVDKSGTGFGRVQMSEWRQQSQKLLGSMRQVIAPSYDVEKRFASRFTDLHLTTKPHIENWPQRPALFPARQKDEPLRVALIGSLGQHKGRDVLIACAQDAWHRKLPLQFVVVGLSHDETILSKLPNVVITGPFEDLGVQEVIVRQKCHASFFASVCPETYSYTLSVAMAANLYPFCFDLGAIAERVKTMDWGRVFDRQWINEPGKINDALLSTELVPLTALPKCGYDSLITDYYELPADFLGL